MRSGEGRRKLKILGYADEIIQMVLAEQEENMRWLMKRCLNRKGLVLNTEKTKMIKFRREEEEEER